MKVRFHRPLLLAMLVATQLAGCVTTQTQPDGSTRVRVSIADALGIKPASSPAAPPAPASAPAPPPSTAESSVPSIRNTKLAGLFTQHPYDGTAASYFPRVAITVTDWSRNNCWNARAKIWWSPTRSEPVSMFSVCWRSSLGFALNNAAKLHMFVEQTSALEQTGNVRTEGPKPPLLAVPYDTAPGRPPGDQAFSGFVEQLVVDTGWGAGAPTNMWIVAYRKESADAVPPGAHVPPESNKQGKAGAVQAQRSKSAGGLLHRAALRRAFECRGFADDFQTAIEGNHIPNDGKPLRLNEPLLVYGLKVSVIEYFGLGGEAILRSYFESNTDKEVVNAASTVAGKKWQRASDGGMANGPLVVHPKANGAVLQCSVDTEGGE